MKYNKMFETKERHSTREKFVCRKDVAPQELEELIYEIHKSLSNSLPDDWIYEVIHEAFYAIEGYYSEDTGLDVILSDLQVDVYNNELIEWSKHVYAQVAIEEMNEEVGGRDFITMIQNGQYHVKDYIYNAVYNFIEKNKEEPKYILLSEN